MKRFAFILSALLLFVGIALAQATKGAVISAPVTEFDFGTILEANGKVSHTFIIKNIAVYSNGKDGGFTLRIKGEVK